MSTSHRPPAAAGGARASAPLPGWAQLLVNRLHFYVGLLVGPFLLVAAATGLVYALTPQIEDAVYRDTLYTPHTPQPGAALPLAAQIAAARGIAGEDAVLAAVRPAPEPGTTTRVMFAEPGMGASSHRAIFVDPATGEVRGDLGVYGTSGVLPIRAWLDLLHRELHLGDFGRLYSELAASWLWVAGLGGLLLWAIGRRRAAGPARPRGVRRWHATLGVWALLGVVFFSATGLTWSQYAGGNVASLRKQLGWGTPGLSTALAAAPTAEAVHGEHGHHHDHGGPAPVAGADAAMFDRVLAVARAEGLTAGRIEIRPPARPDRAWTATEVDRRWPTRVDAVAVDPRTLAVIDRTRFAEFPLAAKLTRWGIDAHMGTLFGLPNQLVLVAFASALLVLVVWGYMMWWRRRAVSGPRLVEALRRAPPRARVGIVAATALIGWFLPVLGASLLAFLAIDAALALRGRRVALAR